MALTVELKVTQSDNRGIYYEETERCLIYLPMHETLEEIYKTIVHEALHHCLSDNSGVQMKEDLDEDMEEKIIFNMQWAEVSL